MTLVARFTSTIAQLRLAPGRAIVAVSGGVDSMVLLDLLAATRAQHQLDLVIGHVDHGIGADPTPRRIIDQAAARYGLPLEVRELALGAGTTETDARVARFAALGSIAEEQEGRVILLAHHANDQAETVLMRLLRGSGPAGLAGMARKRGRYLRPLLAFTRAEIVEHARAAGLDYWSDPANTDPVHLRSWLRTEILPRLEDGLPDLTGRLLQAAAHAGRDRRAWRQVLRNWPGLAWQRDGSAPSVNLTVLLGLPQALQLTLLATMAREAGCLAGPGRVAWAWRHVALKPSGTTADLSRGWKFEVAFNRLRLLGPLVAGPVDELQLRGAHGQAEWGDWEFTWRTEPAPDIQERRAEVAWFRHEPLVVRVPRPGDRLDPIGGIGHRLVVRCFQDAKVPSSARADWPVIECAEGIAWVPRVCRSTHLLPVPGAASLRLEVQPRV